MSRRTLSAAFTHNGALEGLTRRIAATTQQRTFATTSRRDVKHITKFTPTSSSELDQLLETMRQKIILPSFLPAEQRSKLYDPKWEQRLKSDPITIEIDGEILKFYHQNPLKGDIPETKRTFREIVYRLKTPEDFANLRPLLEGLHQAGRKLNHVTWAQLTRIVCERGQHLELLECARSVKRTGFRLGLLHEVVLRLLTAVQMDAVDAGWSTSATRAALRRAEMVLEMLETEEHQRAKDIPAGSIPLQSTPMVILAPMHLAAALGDVDKTTKFARDLVRVWPSADKPLAVAQQEVTVDANKTMESKSVRLMFLAPLAHGLQRAAGLVEDAALREQLQARADALTSEVEALSQQCEKEKVGHKFYQRVFEQKAEAEK
ncbi:uncharacterized protein B0I36DRAFT_359564 [Microdochium trichocladiopsis]|uniref:Uncharacterized protein n=1 Tax=Microdochium trichocladiopsis TaxID=1682393 RepID=A0A9P8YEN6_9PEZI|nr:uncharacterized protein B0I36DRAFT_359564 [Microdochium trichocladiopsis]KAH7037938.1 hypothetical protein B0I36DRAFT_359564 [Microdochium trichocladiopsis]